MEKEWKGRVGSKDHLEKEFLLTPNLFHISNQCINTNMCLCAHTHTHKDRNIIQIVIIRLKTSRYNK